MENKNPCSAYGLPKKKFNFEKLSRNLILVICFIGLLASAFYIFTNEYYVNKTYEEKNIIFEEMTQEEVSDAIELIYDLKPEYSDIINNFYFTSNQHTLARKCDSNKTIGKTEKIIAGCNDGLRNIYVWFSKSKIISRETLCHEILHSIVQIGNEEYFVDDLDKTFSCYHKKNNFLELNLKAQLKNVQ